MKMLDVRKGEMKVVTRFAPTLSGRLHIGSLWNAMLNYIWAKKQDGVFWLRLDGIKLNGTRKSLQDYFIEDLAAFGIVPDFIVKQSDRRELYRQKIEELLKRDDVYFCNCSVPDITKRASEGSSVVIMSRDEKYPSPCGVIQIKVLNERKQDLVPQAQVTANLSTNHNPIENVLNNEPRQFWQPYDIGYFLNEKPAISIVFDQKTFVQHVEITYKTYPWRKFEIFADKKKIASVYKANKFCYHPAGADFEYPQQFVDSVSLAPIECREIKIIPVKYMRLVRREYCYDQFCRNRNLQLDLDKDDTVVRAISSNPKIPDTVLWIWGVADLALSSAIDDQEYGTTHVFRGEDIYPFTMLEAQAGKLVGYQANNIIHGEILDTEGYKYSKWRESTCVTSYFNRETGPEALLSYLAYRTGLVSDLKNRSLNQLVKEANFDFTRLRQHVSINEKEMLDNLRG